MLSKIQTHLASAVSFGSRTQQAEAIPCVLELETLAFEGRPLVSVYVAEAFALSQLTGRMPVRQKRTF